MKTFVITIIVFLLVACTEDDAKDSIDLSVRNDNETLEITCYLTETGGAVDGSHCRHKLMNCTDDREYSLECVLNTETELLECACIIDGENVLEFEAESSICPVGTDDVLSYCDWEPQV